ncbi:hypothetical protein [Rhizobium lusitanum]|uniref:Uncharacterized protein n=1 Tax=Rhizobium lusitanum TaxID=293958 RepID=A0A1C3VRZ6_9HYPH|nr:hypothetical protein [Rhizobium lusitanum]SCB30561.1 hypothetical protein GA0061101_106125 [Rhizobium lusitanum]
MTQEQERRVIESIVECNRILDRARSYQPQFQDTALIAQYEAQKLRLQGML